MDLSSRILNQEFKTRMGVQISDKSLVQRINDGSVNLVGNEIYYKVVASAVTSLDDSTVFKTSSSSGVYNTTYATNIDKGITNPGIWSFCYGIRLLSGINATLSSTDFGEAALDVRWGTINIQQPNGNILLPLNFPCEKFNTSTKVNNLGVHYLANRKWLLPETAITVNMRFPVALTANTNLFIGLLVIQNVKQ